MSWDIFVYDFPATATTPDEIPTDWQPPIIGRRSEIIGRIRKLVPEADFSDSSWGTVRMDEFSIEISLSEHDDDMDGFVMHVRVGDRAATVVAAIVEGLGLRAIDTGTSGFFRSGPDAVEGLKRWREYRNQVLGDG